MESKKFNKLVNIIRKNPDIENNLVVTSRRGLIWEWRMMRYKHLSIKSVTVIYCTREVLSINEL